ncbi:hypothetical protein Hdeb2414_s0002g00060781 [Helianthus debilis subsp. tardiflorus]
MIKYIYLFFHSNNLKRDYIILYSSRMSSSFSTLYCIIILNFVLYQYRIELVFFFFKFCVHESYTSYCISIELVFFFFNNFVFMNRMFIIFSPRVNQMEHDPLNDCGETLR